MDFKTEFEAIELEVPNLHARVYSTHLEIVMPRHLDRLEKAVGILRRALTEILDNADLIKLFLSRIVDAMGESLDLSESDEDGAAGKMLEKLTKKRQDIVRALVEYEMDYNEFDVLDKEFTGLIDLESKQIELGEMQIFLEGVDLRLEDFENFQ